MLLTSGQLHDLLSKAKKKATQTGPRGGRYYVSTEGSKIYTGEPSVKKVSAPPASRPPPTLHHFISAAPHSSQKTQSPVSVEANVEITKLPMRQRVVPAEQRFRSKARSTPSSRVSVKEMMKRWPAYVCRACRAVILPTFAQSTKKNQVTGVEKAGETEISLGSSSGWWVLTEEEGEKERYHCKSEGEAKRLAQDLTQHFREEEPWQQKDELLAVHKTVIEGESKYHTLLEIGDIQPEMVGKKLCPDCFGKHEVISREVTGRTKIKHTAETKRVAHQKEKEQKQKERSIQIALKKFPGKRTEAERQLVAEHEAIQRTRQRAEDEKRKKEDSWGKKKSEEVWIEGQEQAAFAKLRRQYHDKLIREGKDRAEAAQEAANLTEAELSKFQQDQVRAHGKRREDTIKEIEAESGGRRVTPIFSEHEVGLHMEERRQGLPGGKERAIYEETFRPAEAHVAELLRTARMRERMKEKEEPKGKKIKKSLCIFLNKSIYQSAKSPEEAAQHRQWAKEDFSAPSPKIEGDKPKKLQDPQEPKRDIHLEAAHHLTHVFHHLDRTSYGHEDAFKHHWETAHKLINQGADPKHEHYDKVGDYHQGIANDLMMSRPQEVDRNVGSRASKHNFHRRMMSVAAHLFHMSSAAHRLRQRVANLSHAPSLRGERHEAPWGT